MEAVLSKGILQVQSAAASAERDAEFSDWYTNTHIPQVLDIPGFSSARRFRVSDTAGIAPAPGTPTYLTIYEVEADDLAAPLQELMARSMDGRVEMGTAMQLDPPPRVTFFEAL